MGHSRSGAAGTGVSISSSRTLKSSLCCTNFLYRSATPSNEGSFTEPPASPRPATGRLYDHPANCCCIVWESIGPSTYESVGASLVNSTSKLAVSLASAYASISTPPSHFGRLYIPHWA